MRLTFRQTHLYRFVNMSQLNTIDFLKFAFKKSSYDGKKTLTCNAHLSFGFSVVSETAPSSRSVTT